MSIFRTNQNFDKVDEDKGTDDLGDYHRVHIRHKQTGNTFQVTERRGWFWAKDDASGATQGNMDEGGLLGFIARAIKGRRR